MLHLTPSRGFSAELATGLTVSLASFYGIPVSTTQVGQAVCCWMATFRTRKQEPFAPPLCRRLTCPRALFGLWIVDCGSDC
jgi:phosphate/sulfate permease